MGRHRQAPREMNTDRKFQGCAHILRYISIKCNIVDHIFYTFLLYHYSCSTQVSRVVWKCGEIDERQEKRVIRWGEIGHYGEN